MSAGSRRSARTASIRRPDAGRRRGGAGGGRASSPHGASRRSNRDGDTHRRAARGRRGHDAAGLARGLSRLGRRAAGTALPGPVEHGGQGLPMLLNAACLEMWNCGLDGLRHRAGAHHGRGRGARPARLGRAEGDLSRQARQRRMDGHDEPHRAAGGLGPRRPAHARRARTPTAATASPARRSSSPMASTT